jgi:hypothetical protein
MAIRITGLAPSYRTGHLVTQTRADIIALLERDDAPSSFTASDLVEDMGSVSLAQMYAALRDLWDNGQLVSWFEWREKPDHDGTTNKRKLRFYARVEDVLLERSPIDGTRP